MVIAIQDIGEIKEEDGFKISKIISKNKNLINCHLKGDYIKSEKEQKKMYITEKQVTYQLFFTVF